VCGARSRVGLGLWGETCLMRVQNGSGNSLVVIGFHLAGFRDYEI
jgi:hypothetical protein